MNTLFGALRGSLATASLVLGSLAPLAAQADPLVIATGEYAPFTGESLPEGGLVNGLVNRIAQEAGVEVEFEYMPWKRGLALARQGQKAASSYWTTLEDQNGLAPVGPVSVGDMVLFYRKDKPIPEFASAEEIKDITIGATLGYTYYPSFWEQADAGNYKVQTAKDDIANFRKLLAGRVDAFVINRSVGWNMLNEQFTPEERDQLTANSTALATTYGYLQVSTKAEGGAALAERLQSTLDAMEASGALNSAKDELDALMGTGGS